MSYRPGIQRADFIEVKPTPEEQAAWLKKYGPHHSYPYRAECKRCGKRIWYSGLAIGSHLRACPGTGRPTEAEARDQYAAAYANGWQAEADRLYAIISCYVTERLESV